jgi:murein DD-endopeptidase MepM/ murein hydrolase activator NlpD
MPVLSPRFMLALVAALAVTLPRCAGAYDRPAGGTSEHLSECEQCQAINPGDVQLPLAFEWPVQGTIVHRFGETADGTWCDGLDILAAAGTTVLAAQEGLVIYAGNDLRSYGYLLLVAHAEGFITVYARNSDLLVATGDRVHQGQPIATLGRTGDSTDPVLHFQLRAGTEPLDPSRFLNGTQTVRTAEVKQ